MKIPAVSNKQPTLLLAEVRALQAHRPSKGGVLLPLVLQLFFGCGVGAVFAGCKSKSANPPAYAPERIAEVESFFRDHALCRTYKLQEVDDTAKVNPLTFPSGYKEEIIRNGWDLALLRLIQKEVEKARIPFLLPKVCFAVMSSDSDSVGSLEYKEKAGMLSSLVVINLSVNISDYQDKEGFVKALLQHELNHARDYAFFRLLGKKNADYDQTVTDFFIDQAINILKARGHRVSRTRFKAQLKALEVKIEKYPGNKKSLSSYLAEIRAEEKATPSEGMFFYSYSLQGKYQSDSPQEKLSTIALAFDLVLSERLGAEATVAAIKPKAAKLSQFDQELFYQCRHIFDLHYEVSKRAIDYATIPTTKLPPLIDF